TSRWRMRSGRRFIASMMGAIFMKFGRAPTTLITFSMGRARPSRRGPRGGGDRLRIPAAQAFPAVFERLGREARTRRPRCAPAREVARVPVSHRILRALQVVGR